ncbi:hypothetical protein ASC89_27510 [Devosia sp. Root413D1]|jgi:hypothetical protein|uniref:hypothetical protein n=1 Tax=unclassified Devosia TaxID=196773 RepID=UPI0006FDB7F1|nr:hypothetical protein [Devosia sp. Root413D1]KQW83497.1 hypothetical protein ASC89_27510 [Devosia sp. Root413D1]
MRVSASSRPAPAAPAKAGVHLGYLGAVFIVFGLLGLLTSLVLGVPLDKIFSGSLKYAPALEDPTPLEPGEQFAALDYAMVGPFTIARPGQSIWVSVKANLPVNSWVFIEGELLDARQNYLMGFGSELWHETGYDDGPWDETDNNYNLNLTIPEAGEFYLNFKTQGELRPERIEVNIRRTRGSNIPHLIFGIVTLLAGLVMNEIANRTVMKLLGVFR